MSNAVFPTLPGLAWSVGKQPEFSTVVTQAASGAETRIALWSSPRWRFKLKYSLLRDDATNELKSLAGFFLQRQGQFDDFFYKDPGDNAVSAQSLGVGDGTTTSFTCLRNFGGFVEPVGAVNSSLPMTFRVNGTAVASSGYSVSGNSVTFTSAPAKGAVVSGDYGFYFRVRFAEDKADFQQFMSNLWELQSCELVSVK